MLDELNQQKEYNKLLHDEVACLELSVEHYKVCLLTFINSFIWFIILLHFFGNKKDSNLLIIAKFVVFCTWFFAFGVVIAKVNSVFVIGFFFKGNKFSYLFTLESYLA